ncbi:MAG: hypothetical protein ABIK15_15380 [Pseudomonadota bacterium]
MASKKLFFIVVVGLLLLSLPVHAEYTVDENLLYEEESSYTKSEAKLDLLATGRNGFTSNDGDDQSFSASVGGVHRVEKTRTGYWVDIKAAASHDRDENKTVNAVDQNSDSTKFEIRNFDDTYSSTQGLFNYNFADAGHKWYFSDQSPYYGFAQGLANFTFERQSGPDPDDGLESAVAGGVGYGKIVDLGSYERVLIVQDELLTAGLIKQAFSRSVIRELLPFFRRSMDKTDRLIAIKQILVNNGLVTDKDITLDIANDILDAVDESFEKREYGFEARGAFLQEITHRISGADKQGWIFGYVKYEKPLAENHQYTSQFDLYQLVITDANDKTTYAGWLNKITSTFGQYVETEAGLVLTFLDEADTITTEKIYGKLTYEITEILSWENSVSLQLTQDGTPNEDDKSEYEVKSVLTYTIW